jgi:hypothetical protein
METLPMNANDYNFEKISMAVRILATSTDSLRRRLEHAYYALSTVREHELQRSEQRRMLSEIRETITAVDGKDENGKVQASLGRMSDDAARELARKFLDLFTSILR